MDHSGQGAYQRYRTRCGVLQRCQQRHKVVGVVAAARLGVCRGDGVLGRGSEPQPSEMLRHRAAALGVGSKQLIEDMEVALARCLVRDPRLLEQEGAERGAHYAAVCGEQHLQVLAEA